MRLHWQHHTVVNRAAFADSCGKTRRQFVTWSKGEGTFCAGEPVIVLQTHHGSALLKTRAGVLRWRNSNAER